MAYQLGALGAIKTPELVKMSKPTSGNYSQLFGQMNRNQQALGQREDRATLNALGSARAEAIMDGQGGSAELQGIREAQTKALDAQDIPLYDKLTGDLKAQMQIESAEAKADPLGKNQMARKRAENLGRGRGITGNAQSIQTAIKAQAPFEIKLNILENELNSMQETDEGYKEKFNEFQTVMSAHDKLAFTEGQKWFKKKSSRNFKEILQEDKRKQAKEAREIKAFENVDFKDFRTNWQKNNKKLVDSSKLVGSMGSNIPSASKGNTQSVSTLVKKMARLASNEAITMPELELGFSGSAEDQAKAWIEKWTGSGNRIPAKELRAIKVTYNEQAQYYNDKLEEIISDAVMDWQKYNPKAKKSTRGELQRQLMGQTFKRVPLWTHTINYKNAPMPNPKDDSDTSKKRDVGDIKAPDGLTDRERLDLKLKKLMGIK